MGFNNLSDMCCLSPRFRFFFQPLSKWRKTPQSQGTILEKEGLSERKRGKGADFTIETDNLSLSEQNTVRSA